MYRRFSENKYNIMLMWNQTLQRGYTAKYSNNQKKEKIGGEETCCHTQGHIIHGAL